MWREHIGDATDPDGIRVRLDADSLDHIYRRHVEMPQFFGEILPAVAKPDHRQLDRLKGRRRYYRRGVGPSEWLLVVVDFEQTPARVVTAFGTRKGPR